MSGTQMAVLLKAGRTDEAEALAREALRAEPADPEALLTLAKVRLVAGRFAEAEELWARAGSGATSFDGRLVEAALEAQKGDRKGALALYARLVEEDPGRAEAHFGAGHLLLSEGRLAEAEERLARAVAIDPGNAAALFHYASALARLGRPSPAVEHLRRSMEINPTYLPAYFVLADLLDAAGLPERAVEALLTGLEVFPRHPDLTAAATNRLAALGEWRRGHELAFEAARAHPDNPHAVANLARFLTAARRFEDALGLVERLERQGRATVESCLVKGAVCEQLEPPRWGDAEAAYRAAAAIDGRDWSGPNNLGLAVLRQGARERLPEAEEAFREAMRRNPEAPEPVVNLARARALAGAPLAETLGLLASVEGKIGARHPLRPEIARLREELQATAR